MIMVWLEAEVGQASKNAKYCPSFGRQLTMLTVTRGLENYTTEIYMHLVYICAELKVYEPTPLWLGSTIKKISYNMPVSLFKSCQCIVIPHYS